MSCDTPQSASHNTAAITTDATTIQAWRIPADTKSLFSNGVPAATAAALEALLLGPLGFVQSESRERVSLHLQDVAAGAGHALSLDKRSDG